MHAIKIAVDLVYSSLFCVGKNAKRARETDAVHTEGGRGGGRGGLNPSWAWETERDRRAAGMEDTQT